MVGYLIKFARTLAAITSRFTRHRNDQGDIPRFVDLAPTDKADPAGVYSSALIEATENPRVMNIALTGPYGSGKSSIIKSFLKLYRRPVLQISLAAFLPEAVTTGGGVSKQEIERSILQQMLYGADANRLPLSRFKRIQSPGRWSIVASLFIVLGVFACWHLIQKRDAIIAGDYFRPFDLTNWFNLATFAVGGAFIWLVFHHIYVASFGISLKSISLKDIEITSKAASEESILNRHMDEIIYFFQSTKYDLVVIEDLDRFNNADIFVTLREINSLVNTNLGKKRKVRFLYALRDDIFVNTDRTKFFEFIIPVIPIINSSNSIDMVLEQGKRLSLDSRLDKQFLREVSRYLDDLRLIQNIFNEYAIYAASLETDDEVNLNANKLLAVLIYKNVFPSDFEKLHRGKGNLAQVLHRHDRYIAASEARYAAEISEIEKLVDVSEKQLPADLNELRRIYAMALIEQLPANYGSISSDQSNYIPVADLVKHERLEDFLNANQVFVRNPSGYQQKVSLSGFQNDVNPNRTFQQRKKDVENKAASFRSAASKKLQDLRAKLANVRMAKFNEIVRESLDELDDIFGVFGDRSELARFLVLEGFLDDTYYQYTSLFHSGRLSPSDNKFLIRIRSFSNPDPDFQIDNPKEVIAAMRDEDFSRNYVLNVEVVDCLLSDPLLYETQTKKLLGFIASDFDDCGDFFAAYYSRGRGVPTLITRLTRSWPDFVTAAIKSSANLTHVARIITHLTETNLKSIAGKNPALAEFVSTKLPDVLALGIDFPPERLELLGIEATDLSAIDRHPGFIRVIFDRGLYELSIENLDFIFRTVLGIKADARAREQSYTLMLEADSGPLLAKVNGHFGNYLENVLLRLPDNRFESVSAILGVIGREDVDHEPVVAFLEKQAVLLPILDQVPPNLHAVLFRIEKIEPTWGNCLSFLGSESFDADILTQFLNRPATLAALADHEVPDGDQARPLRNFIIENDHLSAQAYASYVGALPRTFSAFPKHLGAEKTGILVDCKRVSFSAKNLSHLGNDLSLGVKFAANNIDEFFKVEDECELEDNFREKLLESNLTDESRLKIIRAMNLSLLAGAPARAALIGKILSRTGIVTENLGMDAAREVILKSHPFETQILLFNMLHEKFDDDQVREILKALPDPLPEIKPGWVTPKLQGNEANLKFATWLKSRGFISSWKQGGFFDNDIRMNLFRK
ncbi:ATP-binding protein [Agrobacterium sp. V1]|uniref:YobI family P-loop NTPase n=1 Tax=Agrobacterium sp. V1 TaxID=3061957 RepID=UPI002673AC4E|nr:ATP-binding protein [Agrobacterium sp. V1]MDO3445430.1 ATP-binding protein [Agrobacterium sp. V1]